MYDNAYSRSIMGTSEYVRSGLIGSMITAFLLNMFIKGALAELLSSIRSL